ncbi:nucleoside hydrolase [Ramaria rubella]|nr:nucleoside hydrolase [Ramaria rubella]
MSSERTPVIIDTDPGVDDTLAILFALASPELEVKAITINFGNSKWLVLNTNFSTNVLKIWRVLHQHFEKYPQERDRFPIFASDFRGDIPLLARGSTGPLEGEQIFAEYFHGRDGLADISIRHPEFSVPKDWQSELLYQTDQPAVDISLDLIRTHPPRSMTYIALGPLTNLARMMRTDPTCVRSRLGCVVAMGGALDAPGNTTAAAEFNFYADPFAVRELLHPEKFSVGLPFDRFLLLPLDITAKHELSFVEYKMNVDSAFVSSAVPSKPEGKTPLAHFTSSFLERTAEVMRQFEIDALQLHDPMAVWCAICNPPVLNETSKESNCLTYRTWLPSTDRTGELTRGMLVVDRRVSGNYKPGDDRAQVQALKPETRDAPVIQAVGEGQFQEASFTDAEGITVIVDSPGSQVLVRLMLERIWGV